VTTNPNMMQFMQMMKAARNPQQAIMNMLENQVGQNPMAKNLLELAKYNDAKGVENVARNIMKEQGLDFDEEFNNFKRMFGF
jgi:hypothetical protein